MAPAVFAIAWQSSGMAATARGIDLNRVVLPRNRKALRKAQEFLAEHVEHTSLTEPGGTRAQLPDEILQIIEHALDLMDNGFAIAVAPVSTKLTTSEAAQVLGVSETTFRKMLNAGKIPSEQAGAQRTLNLTDVLAFRKSLRDQTRAILNDMTRQSAAYGFYAESYNDYAAALDYVRCKSE
jgi:excisionase family DNA binding protein